MSIRFGLISISIALAVLLAGLLAFLLPEKSYACAPRPIGSPLEELERNNSVFRGRVTSGATPTVNPKDPSSDPEVTYEYVVSTVWKGSLAERRTLTTSGSFPGSCGRRFWGGEEYIIYSSDGYSDWFSSRTRMISKAADDLAELGEGQVPIPGTVFPPAPTRLPPSPRPEMSADSTKDESPSPAAEPSNGGGCGISPNRTDLSIAALIVGIVGISLGRRRPPQGPW